MWMQEQEERDYWPQSELQLAYAQSQAEFSDDRAGIDALVSQGRFVVVVESPAYCPRTDAALGVRSRLVADFATREEAEAHAKPLNDDAYEATDGEVQYRVLPKARQNA